MPNFKFSALVDEGIWSVAKKQRKNVQGVELDLTTQLREAGFPVADAAVKDWRLRGIVPHDPRLIELLARYCVKLGRLNRAWGESLLHQARYPDREALVNDLFPDPALSPGPPSAPPPPRPPPHPAEFVGREAEVARVMQGIEERWPVISIFGFAGIGKTSLALEASHRCLAGPALGRLPLFKGVVWISTSDRPEQKVWLTEVLDTIARTWGYTPQMAQDQKQAEVTQLLQENPTLLVIDGYETIEDPELEEWLLHPPGRSKVLVTSQREQPQSAWYVQLKGLAESAAIDLIRLQARRLNLTQTESADAHELKPLIDITNGNPKAIVMALSYLRRSNRTLRGVVSDLYHARTNVQAVFNELYTRHWEALSLDARRLLLAMSLFVETVDRDALGAVADLSGYYLDRALDELLDRFLLEAAERQESPGPDRREADPDDDGLLPYSLHPLTRAFASAKLAEDAAWEQDARTRWVGWYLEFIRRYAPGDPHSRSEEVGWSFPHEPVRRQWRNLLAVSAWCAAPQRERYADVRDLWQADRMRSFAGVLGFWGDRVHGLEWLIDAAERRGDLAVAVDAMSHLGWTLTTMGQLVAARAHLTHAWELHGHVEPLVRLTLARHLAWLCIHEERDHEKRGDVTRDSVVRYAEAEYWLDQHTKLLAAAALPADERTREDVQILEYRGMICDATGDFAQAEQLFQQMLADAEQMLWKRASLDATIRWANVARKNGDFAKARRLLDATLPGADRLDDRRISAFCKRAYALLEQACGNLDIACRWAREALDELQRLGLQSETDELRAVVTACCGSGPLPPM
jgi:NB-ARC domain